MSENWSFVLSRPPIEFNDGVLARAVRGRRVLITGAGGSIGSELSRRVARLNPARLALLDAHEASLWRLRQSLDPATSSAALTYVLADVRDRGKILSVLRRSPADVVFHLAAYKHVALAEENVDQAASVNLVGTLNLIECASETAVRDVVLPTTDKTVNPTSLYGCTKRIIERLVRSAGTGFAGPRLRVARLVNVLGTQGSVVEVFTRQIQDGESLGVTDPAADRYYITMNEAVGFLLGVAAQPVRSGVFLIETGTPIRTVDLARRIHRRLRPAGGTDPSIRITGLKPGERLHEELEYDDEARRPTDFEGIFRLDAPPEAGSVDDWLEELRAIRHNLYEWEPEVLRGYLFELARASRPIRGPSPQLAARE